MLSKEALERYRRMTTGQRLALSLHAIDENEEANRVRRGKISDA